MADTGWRLYPIERGEHPEEAAFRVMLERHPFLSEYDFRYSQRRGYISTFRSKAELTRRSHWFGFKYFFINEADHPPTSYHVIRHMTFKSKNKKAKKHVPAFDTLSLVRIPWFERTNYEWIWKCIDQEMFEDIHEGLAHMIQMAEKMNLRYSYPHDLRHLDPRPDTQERWPFPEGECERPQF